MLYDKIKIKERNYCLKLFTIDMHA